MTLLPRPSKFMRPTNDLQNHQENISARAQTSVCNVNAGDSILYYDCFYFALFSIIRDLRNPKWEQLQEQDFRFAYARAWPASFWQENAIAIAILLWCCSNRNKLSNVKSFIIWRSGEGLSSFDKNILVNFSSEKSKMKPSGVYFLRTRTKNFKSNLVLVVVHAWNVYVEFCPISPLAQNKELQHHAESWKINVEKNIPLQNETKSFVHRGTSREVFFNDFLNFTYDTDLTFEIIM